MKREVGLILSFFLCKGGGTYWRGEGEACWRGRGLNRGFFSCWLLICFVVLQIVDYNGGRTLDDLVKFIESDGKEANVEPTEGEEPPPDVEGEGTETETEGTEGEGEGEAEGEAETTKDEL